jgi:hypothetical protein
MAKRRCYAIARLAFKAGLSDRYRRYHDDDSRAGTGAVTGSDAIKETESESH